MTQEENRHYQAVLNAATDLFFTFGIKKVTVEEISEKAGISKVTLYKYFKNKGDIFFKVMERIFNEALEEYTRVVESGKGFQEIVTEVIRLKMEYISRYSSQFLADFVEEMPEILQQLTPLIEKSNNMVIDLVNMGKEQGEIYEKVTPEMFNLFLEYIQNLMKDPRLEALVSDPQEQIAQLTHIFFYGIMKGK